MFELFISQLHWLRPGWLLLLPATPLIYWLTRHRNSGDSGWPALIPQHLLAPLLPEPQQSAAGQRRTPRITSPLAAILAFILLSLALAGPVWRQAPSPAAPPADSLVIVLDLSLSMLATDVLPNRLTLAKHKVRDILAARQGSLTALVVYAADAHSVTPLSDDSTTTESMLAVLDPLIMPAAGNRADLAVGKALELLTRGAPGDGRILLITDDVQPRYRQVINRRLAESRFQLDTLTVGTRAGGPIALAERGFIRDGERIVISQAAPAVLAELATANGGKSAILTLDDSDLQALASRGSDVAFTDSGATTANPADARLQTQWQEDGYWLLWLALPLLLLVWRRGALLLVAMALLPALPQTAQAISWGELWQREDQRAPTLIEQDPQQAVEQLTTPEWQGAALYRSGEFEAASKRFAEVPGADGAYNRGNALARAGKLEPAIAAYNDALALQPEHLHALANRALVTELLNQRQGQEKDQQQDQQQDAPPESNSGGDDQNEQQQNKQNPKGSENPTEPQPAADSASAAAENGAEPRAPSDKNGHRDENGNGDKDGAESGQSQAPADTLEAPLNQSQEQYLRRVPDNPGGLLQQKFLQQYRQRQTPADKGDTPW